MLRDLPIDLISRSPIARWAPEPVRHRQTKGAATDMFDLQPPRHISTLRI